MTGLISVAMIVKNEATLLKACLDSVKAAVDEIVIVDTGSEDETIDIARIYTDKVFSFPWQEDFSAARNFAVEQCSSKWILSIDADEQLEDNGNSLRELIADTNKEAFFLPLKNCTISDGSTFEVIGVLRLFRNLPHYRYFGKIHEQISIANEDFVGYSECPIISHSYIEPARRQEKRRRNISMLIEQLKQEPESATFLKYYLGCEWLGLGRYQEAYNCFSYAYKNLDCSHIFFRSSAIRSLVACLRHMKKFEQALAICIKESTEYPEYTDLFFDCGIVLEQIGEYEIATRWFKAAVDLGTPGIQYQHSNGTGDFLAFYHLGHCCQMLGIYEDAAIWYEKALQNNNKFIYPLYGLFMMLMTTKSSEELVSYFTEQGYLASFEGRQALGALLFSSSRPDIAVKVCSQAQARDITSCELAKYLLYSGNFKQALEVINDLKAGQNSNTVKIMEMEIMANIFLRDLETASALCLNMVQNESVPLEAWAFLALVKRLGGSKMVIREGDEATVVKRLVGIIDECMRSHGENSGEFIKIAKCCEEIISDFSQGSRVLLEFWQSEIKGIQTILDVKYQNLRGLYVWKQDAC